jgi:hypothetical protein
LKDAAQMSRDLNSNGAMGISMHICHNVKQTWDAWWAPTYFFHVAQNDWPKNKLLGQIMGVINIVNHLVAILFLFPSQIGSPFPRGGCFGTRFLIGNLMLPGFLPIVNCCWLKMSTSTSAERQLRNAIHANDLERAKELCSEVNLNNLHLGHNFLVQACLEGNRQMVELFLQHGASDVPDSGGKNGIIASVLSHDVDIVILLLSKGFSHKTNRRNAVTESVFMSCEGGLRALLHCGAEIPKTIRTVPCMYRTLFSDGGHFVHDECLAFKRPERVFTLQAIARNSIRQNLQTSDMNIVAAASKLPVPLLLREMVASWSE